jgi:hypothetical protein
MLYDPKTEKLDAVGKRLLRATDVLKIRHWCQFEHEDPWKRVCVTEAIHQAISGDVGCAYDAIRRFECYVGMRAETWNDYHCGSEKQAIAALQGAAWLNASPA